MNAISGPAQSAAITQLMTNAAVRAVRPVTSNAQRASLQQVDRYEPSAASKSSAIQVATSITYGPNGKGGGMSDRDGDRS